MEYPEYIQLTSYPIHKQFTNIVYNTIQQLKSSYWREGTKPQNNQLKVVMDATVQLENLYENLLIPHIKAMRCLHVPCVVTREMVNGIQTLRKKDLITLLKIYDPNLGKHVEAPKVIRRGATYTDMRFGVYNRDWMWASIGSNIGKVMMGISTVPGLHVHSDNKVMELGHEYFELRANQNMFDALIKKFVPTGTKTPPISKPALKAKIATTAPSSSYSMPFSGTIGDPMADEDAPITKGKSPADIIEDWAARQREKAQANNAASEPLAQQVKIPDIVTSADMKMKYSYTSSPFESVSKGRSYLESIKAKDLPKYPNSSEDKEIEF